MLCSMAAGKTFSRNKKIRCMTRLPLFLLLLFLSGAQPDEEKLNSINKFTDSIGNKSEYAVLIDMSMPSNEKRLFLIQLETKKIIYSSYVAHGKGSGTGTKAIYFSDAPGGLCTTLGHFKIGKNYIGKHGDSYELIGLENTNANAMKRSIVIHSAWYAEESFIKKSGRCGNSWGCPAVSEEALKKLKPYLSENTIVWIYK